MPLVKIYYDQSLNQDLLKSIVPDISSAVSEILTFDTESEKVTITPGMVKIRFEKSTDLDTNMPDLCIEVEAKSYSARVAAVHTFSNKLADKLVPLMPQGTRIAVWFKLSYASWDARDIWSM